MKNGASTRDRLAVMIKNDPETPTRDLAKLLHVSQTRISQLLEALGYEHVPGKWRRKAGNPKHIA